MAHADNVTRREIPAEQINYHGVEMDLYRAVRDTRIDCHDFKLGVDRYIDKTPMMHGGVPYANSELERSIQYYVLHMLLATHPNFKHSDMAIDAKGHLLCTLRKTDVGQHDMMEHMIPVLMNAIDQKAREVLANHGLNISGRGAEVG
ncbi:MAG: hypothetical protein ACKVOE_08135 [Rickettsiales bacterium]